MPGSRRHWFRFELGHLFVLTLGVALGFTPFKLWEWHAPPEPAIVIGMSLIEVPREQLAALGFDQDRESPRQLGDAATADQLDQLVQANQAKLLVRPMVITLNGQQATVSAVGVIPLTSDPGDGSQSGITVSYGEVGTTLKVTPTLLRNGRVRLAISPEISELDPDASVTVDGVTHVAIRTRSADTAFETGFGEKVVVSALPGVSQHGATEVLIVAQVERGPTR